MDRHTSLRSWFRELPGAGAGAGAGFCGQQMRWGLSASTHHLFEKKKIGRLLLSCSGWLAAFSYCTGTGLWEQNLDRTSHCGVVAPFSFWRPSRAGERMYSHDECCFHSCYFWLMMRMFSTGCSRSSSWWIDAAVQFLTAFEYGGYGDQLTSRLQSRTKGRQRGRFCYAATAKAQTSG